MAINTDLNVSPYFDDYDETKQYHRVLFKPARPVQARELTQMQTILQNQVERFGSNIYKEGTIISGCDFYSIDDLKYVKITDSFTGSLAEFLPRYATLDDSQSNGGVEIDDYLSYRVEGQTTRLTAQIVNVSDGFITRNPDLKTLYIKYTGTNDGEVSTQNEFNAGELLFVYDPFGNFVTELTTSTLANHVGSSLGYGVDNGVIFQKGHFLYVDPQNIIISKYTNTPNNIVLGFDIEESIVNSNQDNTLLDNSQGFLNKNAPGADRLKLTPALVKYDLGEQPEDFFAVVTFKSGEAVSIRDITEFNSVEKEMAKRSFDQSGNYVSRGMRVSLEPGADDKVFAAVSPGTAYSSGFELSTVGTRYFEIEPVTETSETTAQRTGVKYGGYLPVGEITIPFDISGATTYKLYNSSGTEIGTCNVQNVESGKIYIYNIRKSVGFEDERIGKIGNNTTDAITTTGSVLEQQYAPAVHRIGGIGVSDVSEIALTRRIKLDLSGSTSTSVINLPYTASLAPIDNQNIVVIDQTNTQVTVNSTQIINDGNANPVSLQLNLSAPITPDGSHVYYDEQKANANPDFKSSLKIHVRTAYSSQYRRASLGVPDAYELVSVRHWDDAGNSLVADVTDKFVLRSNQKDKYYDLSYIELKGGEEITIGSQQSLKVEFKVFRHDNTTGDGFYVANSYVNINREDIPQFTGTNGVVYDLASCFDFRPAVQGNVQYSITDAGASFAINYELVAKYTPTPKNLVSTTIAPPSNNSTISSTTVTYLSRVDQITIDNSGEMTYRKGKPAKTPSIASTPDLVLAEIVVPGNPVTMNGVYAPRLKNVSIRAYTMKDIANIESQINRILEISATSMLAQEANSLLITDGAGNNRFKNGVIVDSFRNMRIADVTNPEFFAGIDKFRQRLTPPVKQFPIYLKRSSSTNASQWPEIITKAATGIDTVLSQTYGTTYRNLVQGTFLYKGQGEISPHYDGGHDVTTNPEPATINIDFETPLNALNANIMELLKLSGADTSVDEVGREVTGSARNTAGGRAGTDEITTITEQFRTYEVQQSGTSIKNTKVGEFLTSAEFKPYMESKEVKILVYGLRPNAQHYFYFEEDAVSAMTKPGRLGAQIGNTPRATEIVSNGSYGDPVYSDNNGQLIAIFKIPESTYLVGERMLEIVDVDDYNSIDTARSSYANFAYNAFNFDYEKQALTVNTRVPQYDAVKTKDFTDTRDIVSRFIPDPPRRNRDPLAQTFYIKKSAAQGNKYVFIDSIDVYFKSKSATKGVSVEIREVINSYPSRQAVPFGSVHYNSKEIDGQGTLVNKIKVSNDGSLATNFKFSNPVRVNTEREYAIVVKPDGGDPSFNVFTAKLGERDLATNKSIVQDWGDGVLFSSTNNRTWTAHGDEDLKFNIKVLKFSIDDTQVNFVADDMEFFTVADVTGKFELNEIAYVKDTTTTVNAGVVVSNPTQIETADQSGINILVGQYAIIEQNDEVWASKVTSVDGYTATIEEASPIVGACTLSLGIGGYITHFNPSRPDQVHIKKSTATQASRFINGGTQIIRGINSGAFATIETVDDIGLSSLQAHMYKAESQNSFVDFDLMNGSIVQAPAPTNDELYLLSNNRVVESLSNIIGGTSLQNFKIRGTLKTNANEYASPIVDDDISLLQGYKYYITNNENTTAKYVSREVSLNSDLYAEGLKVFAACHRPDGTDIKVYARFKYRDDIENLSEWKLLTNLNESMFSNSESIQDYREFEFELAENDEKEFITFQLKFVLLSPSIGQVPYVFDYRAIAVT